MVFQTYNPRLSDDWTVERIVLLLKLDAEGELSRSQIARELAERTGSKFSRNAVIGKLSRLGVPLKDKKPVEPKPEKMAKAEVPKPQPAPAPVVVPPVIKDSLRLSIMDLTDDTCRYPTNDSPFEFCGHPVSERSFCAGHYRLCYYSPRASRPDVSRRWLRSGFPAFRMAACG